MVKNTNTDLAGAEYIHNKVVVERIVNEGEYYVYIYSSAINYAGGRRWLEVEFLD